jgi:hypothetical protein
MMEARFPMFFMIALAVGAGLLAVFVLWVSKNIANEKTRSQGVAIAGITVGVLLLGLLVTRSSHRPLTGIHDTPVPPSATTVSGPAPQPYPSVAPPADAAGRVDVHAHHQPPVDGRVATKLAWGPLTFAAVAIAVGVLVATSRKGLAASLAGLGIAGAVLLMIVYAASERQVVQEVAAIRAGAQNNGNTTREIVEWDSSSHVVAEDAYHGTANSSPTKLTAEAKATSSENTDHSIDDKKAGKNPKDDDKSKADDKLKAEASPTTATEATNAKAPAWIYDEPTMKDGIYRAVVVSGPYSTRRECEMQLDRPLREALVDYAEDHLSPNSRYFGWADIGYVRNNMIAKPGDAYWHLAEVQSGVGKMYNLYVQLTVQPRDVAWFAELARRNEERRAVETASAGGIFVFGALIVLYGGLRFIGRRRRASPADTTPPAPAEATA